MENTDSKYYTPLLEEYFIGFEVEGKVTTKKDGLTIEQWFKLPVSNEILSSLLNGEAQRGGGMTLGGFRCKYLDKENIESLNWKFSTHVIEYESCDFIEGYELEISNIDKFIMYFKNGMWRIYKSHIYNVFTGNSEVESLFLGTIKNISELKKLLIQLKIK